MKQDNIEKVLKNLGAEDVPADAHRIAQKISKDFSESLMPKRQKTLLECILESRITRLAVAAAIIIAVLGVINFWLHGPENGKWWQEPPAVWADVIIQSLEKVKTLVYRQHGASVSDYGLVEMDVEWEKRFCSENAYRCDRYDYHTGTKIVNTQWILREPNGPTKYEVSFEYQCYFREKTGDWPFYSGQMDSFRYYVGLLKSADRILDTRSFEGRECVGFEIDLAKWGTFPKGRTARVWFDVETKLPARIEKHGFRSRFDAAQSYTIIHDRFEYYMEVPADIFIPQIPQDFVNARPEEVIAARKGEMTFADVPEGLKEEVVEAMKNTETVVYQQGDRTVYLSRNNWRYDYYSAGRLQKTEWYVGRQVDTQETGFEMEDRKFWIVRTMVDHESKTYQVSSSYQIRHPMHQIVFFAGLVDRADRILQNRIVDEVECIGFEICAKKYGDNPDSMIHRLWFNADTKLLVRMEFEWDTDSPSRQELMQQFERGPFQWDRDLPEDTFVPEIPEGYTPPPPKAP